MTQEQADKIISAIAKDATLRGCYRNADNTLQCVLGGLAKAAGFDLMRVGTFNTFCIDYSLVGADEELVPLAEAIESLGLDMTQMKRLQMVNDDCLDIQERRARLIAEVKSWAN